MVFQDKDGAYDIIYGGWKHRTIARLNDTFTGFIPFADGTTFKEITPSGYVEDAYMMLTDNKYYFKPVQITNEGVAAEVLTAAKED